MKKLWLLAGCLVVVAVITWMIAMRGRHPDTSSVASYVPYTEIQGDIAPSWSPDDKEVIYCRLSNEEATLYVVPANGGTPRPFLTGPRDGCLSAWSPDGTRVAFS
jgi:Tol biopolymer transport system component